MYTGKKGWKKGSLREKKESFLLNLPREGLSSSAWKGVIGRAQREKKVFLFQGERKAVFPRQTKGKGRHQQDRGGVSRKKGGYFGFSHEHPEKSVT